VLERSARVLRLIKDLVIDSSHSGGMKTFSKGPIQLHRLLIDSTPFQTDDLRLGTPSHSTYLHPFLRILSPNRLVVPSNDVYLYSPHLPLTFDRPLFLDCFGREPLSLAEIPRSSILSIIWCPTFSTPFHRARILVLLSHAQQLRIVVNTVEQEEATSRLVRSIRRESVGLNQKDVEVVYRRGSRRHYGKQEEGDPVVWLWNDELVEGL
jgi:hypothetical protein